MSEAQSEVDLPDAFADAIAAALEDFGLTVSGELAATPADGGGYEVAVPIDGRLILEEVTANQGRLLAFRTAEVMLRGFEDGRILVTVRDKQDAL